MTEKNMDWIHSMLRACKGYSDETVEATVVAYGRRGLRRRAAGGREDAPGGGGKVSRALLEEFERVTPAPRIELLIEFFEALLEKDRVAENGIVFTPRYIADYIARTTIPAALPEDALPSVIDPGCGCGIFLVSAAEVLHRKLPLSYVDIFNRCVCGVDIDPDNVRRCKMILRLFVRTKGEDDALLAPRVFCADSLKTDWRELFGVEAFDCVIGNPPYVNTHDMPKETAAFLKENFRTTKEGVYNIFYAFIERAMDFLAPGGKLGYIVPNNFLTIKAAKELRRYLAEYQYLESMIDFADNMAFKPVRTYNCVIRLSKQPRTVFTYKVLEKTEDLEGALKRIRFSRMNTARLDANGWKLTDRATRSNLDRIEGQPYSIRPLVRTGIATLRDGVYMVDYDGENYYKDVNGKRYVVESALVKGLYKIPELKNASDISQCRRHIIFPYQKGESGFEIIEEEKLKEAAPRTYRYLLARREELDKRDKGACKPAAWYAYGRTQGLNRYGRKLLFPTFASRPRFTLVEDEYALFCNGYAVFEGGDLTLALLARILNSQVMHYYVSNTSYAIEGGYFCYQKKYIEKFTIPRFTDGEIAGMERMDAKQLDQFLFEKYGLA